MKEHKHTALPLNSEGFDVFDKDGIIFCHASGDTDKEAEANAVFIVTAVNSHYELIEALKESLDILIGEMPKIGNNYLTIEKIEEVLKKAGAL